MKPKKPNDGVREALLFFTGGLSIVLIFSGLLTSILDAFAMAAW